MVSSTLRFCCAGPLSQQHRHSQQQWQQVQPDESHPAPQGLVQHRPLHSPRCDEETTLNLHSIGTTSLKVASLPELDTNLAEHLWQLVDAVLDVGSVPHATLASSYTSLSCKSSQAGMRCGITSACIGEHHGPACISKHGGHASSASECELPQSTVPMLGSAATSYCTQSDRCGVSRSTWLPIIEPKQVLLTAPPPYHPA